MSLGVYGFGCEDSLTHLMNFVWPNIFEVSPHMVQSFNDAVDGFRVSVGPGKVLQYALQVCIYVGGGGEGWGGGCEEQMEKQKLEAVRERDREADRYTQTDECMYRRILCGM